MHTAATTRHHEMSTVKRARGHFEGVESVKLVLHFPRMRHRRTLNLGFMSDRCNGELRLNIWQCNMRSTATMITQRGHTDIAVVLALLRAGHFARIRSMKFIGRPARSGHSGSERAVSRERAGKRRRRTDADAADRAKEFTIARRVRVSPSRGSTARQRRWQWRTADRDSVA